MKTIFKYPIPITDSFTMDMPYGAEILTVDMQGSTPCIWAIVDTSEPTIARAFALRGTGHGTERLSKKQYIGTFQMDSGALIFHLFQVP